MPIGKATGRVVALWCALILLLAAQLAVSHALKPYRPAISEMPQPPNRMALKAMAFGDDQFLFRAESSWLQDVGDGGGRVRPLRDYDYDRVANWLRAVDQLDRHSSVVFAVGSTYFGALSDPVAGPPRVKILATYFKEAGLADIADRWSWLVWSAVKIQHFVKDRDMAHEMGDTLLTLRRSEQAPYWLPLLAGPLYRAAGEGDLAASVDLDPAMIALRQRATADLNTRLRAMKAQGIAVDEPE